MTEVSVVIPAYNHAEYLGEAIESALHSRGVELQVIVVDDGSTDATPDVVRSFAAVEYVRQDNAGAPAAYAAGASRATGPVLALLNDDDLYEPTHLRAAIDRMTATGADLCLSEPTLIGSGPLRVDMEAHLVVSRDLIRRYGRALTLLAHNWFVSSSAVVITHDAWNGLGGMRDLGFCHDLDLVLRLLASGRRATYLDEPTWRYRCHGGNTVTMIQTADREADLRSALACVSDVSLPMELRSVGYGALNGDGALPDAS